MNRCGRPADAAAATTTTRARTPSRGGSLSLTRFTDGNVYTVGGGERAFPVWNFVLRTAEIRNRHFRGVRYLFYVG